MSAPLPHLDAVSRYRGIALLKLHRELEQGNLNRSLHDLSRLLRLARDLVPEGLYYADMASVSLLHAAVNEVVLPLLSQPDLTVQHCDRLLAMLVEHEARSIDMDSESLRARYLCNRATLRDLVFHQDRCREALKSWGSDVKSSITAEIAEPRMTLVGWEWSFSAAGRRSAAQEPRHSTHVAPPDSGTRRADGSHDTCGDDGAGRKDQCLLPS